MPVVQKVSHTRRIHWLFCCNWQPRCLLTCWTKDCGVSEDRYPSLARFLAGLNKGGSSKMNYNAFVYSVVKLTPCWFYDEWFNLMAFCDLVSGCLLLNSSSWWVHVAVYFLLLDSWGHCWWSEIVPPGHTPSCPTQLLPLSAYLLTAVYSEPWRSSSITR